MMEFSNGDLYLGDFREDELWGQGVLHHADTGNIVRGDVFRGGRIEGDMGFYEWAGVANREYCGEIKRGLPNGKGKKIYYFKKFFHFFIFQIF